jgi:hypothetical protein
VRLRAQLSTHVPTIMREDLSHFWSGEPGKPYRGWTTGALGLRGPLEGRRQKILAVWRITIADSEEGRVVQQEAVATAKRKARQSLVAQVEEIKRQAAGTSGTSGNFAKCPMCDRNQVLRNLLHHCETECPNRDAGGPGRLGSGEPARQQTLLQMCEKTAEEGDGTSFRCIMLELTGTKRVQTLKIRHDQQPTDKDYTTIKEPMKFTYNADAGVARVKFGAFNASEADFGGSGPPAASPSRLDAIKDLPSDVIDYQQRALALHRESVKFLEGKLQILTDFVETNVKPCSSASDYADYSRALRKWWKLLAKYHPAAIQSGVQFRTWQGKFFRLYLKSPTAARNKKAVMESRTAEWRAILQSDTTNSPILAIMNKPAMRTLFWQMYIAKLDDIKMDGAIVADVRVLETKIMRKYCVLEEATKRMASPTRRKPATGKRATDKSRRQHESFW